MGTTKKKAPAPTKPAQRKSSRSKDKPDIVMVKGKPYDRRSALGPPVEYPESWSKPTEKPEKPEKKRTAMQRLRAGEQVSGEEILADHAEEETKRQKAKRLDGVSVTSPLKGKVDDERAAIVIGATVFMRWDPSGPSNDLFPGAGTVRRAKLVGFTKDSKPKVQMFRVDAHGAYTGELGSEVRTFEVAELLGQVHAAIYPTESAQSYDDRIASGGKPNDAQLMNEMARKSTLPPAPATSKPARGPVDTLARPPLPATTKAKAPEGIVTRIPGAEKFIDAAEDPKCPKHALMLIPTRSGSQRVCPAPGGCGWFSKKQSDGTFTSPTYDGPADHANANVESAESGGGITGVVPDVEPDAPWETLPEPETAPARAAKKPEQMNGRDVFYSVKGVKCPIDGSPLVRTVDGDQMLCKSNDCTYYLTRFNDKAWLGPAPIAPEPEVDVPMLEDDEPPPWEV